MKTACLLFLVVPAAAQYKVVTSGTCTSDSNGGKYSWITTKSACETAASALGKKGKTIPVNQVDNNVYTTEPPYCTYYPDGTVQNTPLDTLWFLSAQNTGACSPQRECICNAPDDSAAASLGSGALGMTLLAVTTAALLRGLVL